MPILPKRLASLALALSLAFIMTACDTKPRKGIKGKATDFTLKDLNGNEVSLSDFRGKVVLLDFWATWCPPCVSAIPELVALHGKYRDKGFEIIGISMDHSVSDAKNFYREKNISYTVVMSTPDVEKQFGVVNIPVLFLIDKTGKVATKHLGFGSGMSEDIEKDIRLLIEDMPLKIQGQGK